MRRDNVNDLLAFLAVARERSFTRAAKKAGLSQSALSHTISQLESRLGIRLLTRTTRAVSPTEAGQRLLETIGPSFDEIESQVAALSELRDKPAGTIRIAASDYAINYVLWPKLRKFLPKYPDIKVELTLDNGLTDIVTQRYDAGVRMGEQLAKDMISARIGPDFRFAVVGAKSYFKNNAEPSHPQDLVRHMCINDRHATEWRPMGVGVRGERPGNQNPGRRPTYLQQHHTMFSKRPLTVLDLPMCRRKLPCLISPRVS